MAGGFWDRERHVYRRLRLHVVLHQIEREISVEERCQLLATTAKDKTE